MHWLLLCSLPPGEMNPGHQAPKFPREEPPARPRYPAVRSSLTPEVRVKPSKPCRLHGTGRGAGPSLWRLVREGSPGHLCLSPAALTSLRWVQAAPRRGKEQGSSPAVLLSARTTSARGSCSITDRDRPRNVTERLDREGGRTRCPGVSARLLLGARGSFS